MANTIKPLILAIVLCDMIIREAGTGKATLIGTFNGIFAQSFPCVHPVISVYIAITEGRGRMPCKLSMTRPDGTVMFELPGQLDFGTPTSIGELAFNLQQVRFDEPGVYAIEFSAGSEMLASRRLIVQKAEQKPG